MERIRIAALQYYIRPVETFAQFHVPVEGLVETAADYRCDLMVFPEYFTVQLLTLQNVKRPIQEQIRGLANEVPRFVEMMGSLAKKSQNTKPVAIHDFKKGRFLGLLNPLSRICGFGHDHRSFLQTDAK